MVHEAAVGNHLKALLDLLLVSSVVNDKSTLFTGDGDAFAEVSLSMTQ